MNVLLILQGPAYGDERSYNGLRLASSIAKRGGVEEKVFLIGDAVGCAVSGQHVPDGYYHLDRMIASAARHGAEIGCCCTAWTPGASPTKASSPTPTGPALRS